MKPTQLLQNVARFKGFPPPVLSEDGSSIRYGGKDYSLDEFGKHTAMDCRLVARQSNTFMLLGLRYRGVSAEWCPNTIGNSTHTTV